MRRIAMVAVSVMALLTMFALGQEKPWFDIKQCAFCQQFGKEPGLLQHMHTEYHNISDGIVSFTHIDTGYEDAFQRAQVGVGSVLKEMRTTGKVPYMCEHCSMLGKFTMAGVRQELVPTNYGSVVIFTSPDSSMVSELQHFGKRSNEELVKFMTDPEGGSGKKKD